MSQWLFHPAAKPALYNIRGNPVFFVRVCPCLNWSNRFPWPALSTTEGKVLKILRKEKKQKGQDPKALSAFAAEAASSTAAVKRRGGRTTSRMAYGGEDRKPKDPLLRRQRGKTPVFDEKQHQRMLKKGGKQGHHRFKSKSKHKRR